MIPEKYIGMVSKYSGLRDFEVICGSGEFNVSSENVIVIAEGDMKVISNSSNVEVFALDGASVTFVSVGSGKQVKRGFVFKDASINWYDAMLNSSSFDTKTDLNSIGASTRSLGLFVGNGSDEFDIENVSCHNSPYTTSNMFTRGVLNGKAKAKYRGLIDIKNGSFKSVGYQKEDTLMLSSDATIDAVPVLEIANNDVKCKHGTSIGQLDKDKLFYMMSRGLSERESILKIVEGFFDPILKHVDIDINKVLSKC